MTTGQGSSAVFTQCLARCQREDTRLFVVLAGSQSWSAPTALALLARARAMTESCSTSLSTKKPPRAPQINRAIWIADDLPANAVHSPGLQHVHRAQAQRLLGNETTAAVIDAHDGLNANTLAAVTGTLCGGGLFILTTPPLDAWPHYDDPDYQRMAQPGAGAAPRAPTDSSFFLTRMVSYLRAWAGAQENILLFEDKAGTDAHDFATGLTQPGQLREVSSNPSPPTASDRGVVDVAPLSAAAPLPTTGQQRLRDAAAILYRRRAGILLLTAARGRGKSTALAFAVFDALQNTALKVVVVAPHRSNAALFFSTLQTLCSGLPAATVGRVSYHPADALLQHILLQDACCQQLDAQASHEKPLLIVDEAAGLALSLLDKLDAHYPRKIIASTTQGYEGSGQGLLLRFAQRRATAPSDQQPDQPTNNACGSPVHGGDYFEQLSLTQPIRWAEGDALEDFIARLLCLEDSRVTLPASGACRFAAAESEKLKFAKPGIEKLVFEKLDKAEFIRREALLQNVFGLLVEAHYQTQPNDLRFILDTVYSHLWLARDERQPDCVAGVLLAVEEGGMPGGDDLTAAIVAGKRRPRGNLVAQRLANFSGDSSWCTLRSLRVMRIAVAAGQRRSGVASQLLHGMSEWAGTHNFSYWSSSFGFREELASFWKSVNAVPVYLGMHLDKSSGARNLMVVNPLRSALMSACVARAARNLAADLGYWYPRFLSEFSVADCNAIAHWAAQCADTVNLQAQCPEAECGALAASRDLDAIARFVRGELDIAAVLPALARLAACHAANSAAPNQQEAAGWPNALADYIEWAPDWRALGARTGVSGQAALSEELKRICATLVR